MSSNLDPGGTRGFLILPQIDQQFTEPLLAGTTGTAGGALARHIDQLGDALPTGATGRGVLAAGQELFGFGLGLRTVLVCLVVVRNVEVVNVLAGLLQGCFLLLV